MIALTPLQTKVLDFIKLHIDSRDCAPTLGEINAYFGWGHAAKGHVDSLRQKKQIRIAPNTPRGISIREAV